MKMSASDELVASYEGELQAALKIAESSASQKDHTFAEEAAADNLTSALDNLKNAAFLVAEAKPNQRKRAGDALDSALIKYTRALVIFKSLKGDKESGMRCGKCSACSTCFNCGRR